MNKPKVLLYVAMVDTAASMVAILDLPARAATHGATAASVGALTGLFAGCQVLSGIVWSGPIHRVGRHAVLLVGLVVSLLGLLMLLVSNSLTGIMLSRAVHGIGVGTVSAAIAAVIDAAPAARRAKAIGQLGAATSAGAVVTPLLVIAASVLVPTISAETIAGWVVAILLTAAVPGVAKTAARARQLAARRVVIGLPRSFDRRGIAHRSLGVRYEPISPNARHVQQQLLVLHAFTIGAAAGLPAMLPSLVRHVSASVTTAGSSISAAAAALLLGVVGLVFRSLVVAPAVTRYGLTRVLRAGLASITVALFAFSQLESGAFVYSAVVALAVGTALTLPALGALLARVTPASQRVTLRALQQSLSGVVRVFVPLGLGLSIVSHQHTVALLAMAGGTAIACAWLHPMRFATQMSEPARYASTSDEDVIVHRITRLSTQPAPRTRTRRASVA